jgi:hypothetical protein
MDAILQIPIRIIKEQEMIIGPLAWHEAEKVSGLNVDQAHTSATLAGDAKDVINRLVAQYEKIFGRASHAVCHDAVADILVGMTSDQIPDSLK